MDKKYYCKCYVNIPLTNLVRIFHCGDVEEVARNTFIKLIQDPIYHQVTLYCNDVEIQSFFKEIDNVPKKYALTEEDMALLEQNNWIVTKEGEVTGVVAGGNVIYIREMHNILILLNGYRNIKNILDNKVQW